MQPRLQGYDATFGFDTTDGLNLHKAGVAATIKGEKGVTVFNDHTNKYWDASNKYSSVIVPDTHTQIEVLWNSLNKLETLVHVKPVK